MPRTTAHCLVKWYLYTLICISHSYLLYRAQRLPDFVKASLCSTDFGQRETISQCFCHWGFLLSLHVHNYTEWNEQQRTNNFDKANPSNEDLQYLVYIGRWSLLSCHGDGSMGEIIADTQLEYLSPWQLRKLLFCLVVHFKKLHFQSSVVPCSISVHVVKTFPSKLKYN